MAYPLPPPPPQLIKLEIFNTRSLTTIQYSEEEEEQSHDLNGGICARSKKPLPTLPTVTLILQPFSLNLSHPETKGYHSTPG